jgi:hypothetical protein
LGLRHWHVVAGREQPYRRFVADDRRGCKYCARVARF